MKLPFSPSGVCPAAIEYSPIDPSPSGTTPSQRGGLRGSSPAAVAGCVLRRGAWAALVLAVAGLSACVGVAQEAQNPPVDESVLPVAIAPAFEGLKVARPIVLTHAGDGSGRTFIASQLGRVYVVPKVENGDERAAVGKAKVFLDIVEQVVYKDRENEEGLLGLAFHPKYAENGEVYVYYTSAKAPPHTSVISRFRVSRQNPDKLDPKSEVEVLRIPQPYWNHNGGTIVFGPDGYLYVGLGDGGAAKDPQGHGQNLQTLLGSILRIDVDRRDGDRQYGIPADNPFASTPGARPEIYAYGLRNIWRMAFDRETGVLWAADVGQDLWEEINLIVKGGNYGWNIREGFHPFASTESRPDLIDPIWEYHHSIGKSITGGHVYRGQQVPSLQGLYLYADYVTGKIWALRYDAQQQKAVANHKIEGNILPVMTFGEDEAGEVYFTRPEGAILRFVEKQGS